MLKAQNNKFTAVIQKSCEENLFLSIKIMDTFRITTKTTYSVEIKVSRKQKLITV